MCLLPFLQSCSLFVILDLLCVLLLCYWLCSLKLKLFEGLNCWPFVLCSLCLLLFLVLCIRNGLVSLWFAFGARHLFLILFSVRSSWWLLWCVASSSYSLFVNIGLVLCCCSRSLFFILIIMMCHCSVPIGLRFVIDIILWCWYVIRCLILFLSMVCVLGVSCFLFSNMIVLCSLGLWFERVHFPLFVVLRFDLVLVRCPL